VAPKHRAIKRSSTSNKNTYAGKNPKISLDDFTNLNLNNRQPTSGDLWAKLGQGLKIPDAENRPEVQEQIRWFIAHPSYLERTTERARPYLYTVYEEVKSRNLPTELVLLPINESAYYPFSYSSTGATGIWQLMPGTANDWGLKHNFWYDGRRDIFDSTNAALDYLTYLNNYFNGDWLLTLAAYDTGEGNVQKAIARNLREGLPTDFWSLHLSSETRTYVPRLLALASIIAHPDRYPASLPSVDAKAVVGSVEVDHQIKLTDAAELAGISVNQLKVLNPGLSRTATDPESTKLLLPVDSIDNFKAHISSLAPAASEAPQNYTHYHVQRGDTLQSIADHFNADIDTLRQANNIYTGHVSPGTVLLIPSANLSETFKPQTQINLDQRPLKLSEPSHQLAHKKSKKNTKNPSKNPAHPIKSNNKSKPIAHEKKPQGKKKLSLHKIKPQ
jgi:membrane-bound lytic murein transglycosylase D